MPEKTAVDKPLLVIQFTDTHFFASQEGRLLGVDTAKSFAQVRELAASTCAVPDFYLLTGDLSQDETAGSYSRFAKAVGALPAPAYFIPGNHDVEDPMETSFRSSDAPFRFETEFSQGGWRFILLNSHAPGKVGGVLPEGELSRLKRALESSKDEHVLIVLHHHPLPVGAAWIDTIGVDNREAFYNVIDAHDTVRAVLFGHIHQEFEDVRKGVRYMGTPSTCVQFKPRTTKFAVDAVAPGFRWLEFYPDGTIQSEVVRLDQIAEGLDLASAGY